LIFSKESGGCLELFGVKVNFVILFGFWSANRLGFQLEVRFIFRQRKKKATSATIAMAMGLMNFFDIRKMDKVI
jgi:hypothetical protein